MKDSNLTVVAEYNNEIEAEMAKSLLDSENIYAEIEDRYMSSIYPTGVIPSRLLVYEEDADRASALLAR